MQSNLTARAMIDQDRCKYLFTFRIDSIIKTNSKCTESGGGRPKRPAYMHGKRGLLTRPKRPANLICGVCVTHFNTHSSYARGARAHTHTHMHNTHRRGSQTVLHQVLACITSSRILRVGVLRGAGAQLLLGLVGAKAIQSELVAQCIPLLALYVQARGASGGRQVRDGTVLCRLRCNLRCVLKLKTLRQVCACVTGLIEVNK